jgi:hypothetical protein
MPALFSNNASATLASSISTSATSITVSTGMGVMFPTVSAGTFFYATLTDSSNNLEIVRVTARTSDILTVVRAQEGTTARIYAAADKIELRITAAVLSNLVQLDGAQTISGVKTFSTAPTFSTALAVASGGTGSTTATGSGAVVLDTSPTLVTPALGTPSALVGTNITGTAAGLSSGNAANLVTTNFTLAQVGTNLTFATRQDFTASITTNVMTVSVSTANEVLFGAVLTGTGVTGGTTVGEQLTSTETAAATPAFSSDGAVGESFVTVSSVSGVAVRQMISGTGIPNSTYVGSIAGTTVSLVNRTGGVVTFTVQASGTYTFRAPNAKGTYTVSASQTVASTTITGTKTIARITNAGVFTTIADIESYGTL